MAKAAKKAKGASDQLSEHLKNMLGARATPAVLAAVAPDILEKIKTHGALVPTVAELLADKVVKLALEPGRGNRWAVELVFDRTEGKAAQGLPMREDKRHIEERLDDVTAEHLNALGRQFARQAREQFPPKPDAADEPAGPAARLLDLPDHGARGPEGPAAESPVEADAAAAG